MKMSHGGTWLGGAVVEAAHEEHMCPLLMESVSCSCLVVGASAIWTSIEVVVHVSIP